MIPSETSKTPASAAGVSFSPTTIAAPSVTSSGAVPRAIG